MKRYTLLRLLCGMRARSMPACFIFVKNIEPKNDEFSSPSRPFERLIRIIFLSFIRSKKSIAFSFCENMFLKSGSAKNCPILFISGVMASESNFCDQPANSVAQNLFTQSSFICSILSCLKSLSVKRGIISARLAFL